MPAGVSFQSIAAGYYHTCALTTEGKAYCWGMNLYGQLGNNSTTGSRIPVAVQMPAGISFQSIAAGYYHTCAITTTDHAYCWGQGGSGRLGNNSTTNSSIPVAVQMPAGVSFQSIATGSNHTCAITTTGHAYCWGANGYGRLGNNSTTDSSIPVAVQMPAGVSFQSIAADYYHTCAITTTGHAYCWGMNNQGQLGNNSTTDSLTPVAVQMPAGVSFQSIAAGVFHTCAITTTGQAYCWGANGYGQLGNNSTTGSRIPVAVQMPAGISFQSIVADYFHTCAITTTGHAYCWGMNQHGQLGNNSTAGSLTPLAVSSVGVNVPVEQSASRLYEWNNAVQPGTPLAATNAVATLPEVGSSFRIRVGLTAAGNKTLQSITAGYAHTCALTTTGQAYCWGRNEYGQLGNNSTTNSRIPVAVQMPAGVARFQSITTNSFHTCALTTEGKAYCWGWNVDGQLGNNSTTDSSIPAAVQMPAGVSFQSITAGYYHTCALTATNQAYCWGYNEYGQLGNNSTTDSSIPVAVQMPAGVARFQSITTNSFHTCALTTEGKAYCWGWNIYDQLGNNSTTDSSIPAAVQMPAGVSFQSITAGDEHTCALTTTGKAYCWGTNGYGQLGNGSTTKSSIPVAVAPVKTMDNTTVPPGNMKLRAQYAKKTVASCSAVPSGDWQNITTNSSLRYAATGPAHQTAISAISDNPALPTNSNNYAHQSIVRPTTDSSLTFTNNQGVESGQTGLWDLVLADNGLEQNTSYCVRVVTDTAAAPGTSVDTYIAYPEFKTPTGSLDIRFVNNTTNATIANPTIDFTPTVTQSSVARTTANLTEAATGTRHLEIKNTLPTGWSVTLSATAGSNARWSSGTDDYAFNNTEANGRLSVLFNNTVITRISGSAACASATKGQNGVFTATNTVKIASAAGGAAGCTYRIADIGLQQTIPVYQKPGTYTLPMTLTAVAE